MSEGDGFTVYGLAHASELKVQGSGSRAYDLELRAQSFRFRVSAIGFSCWKQTRSEIGASGLMVRVMGRWVII